MEPGTEVRAVFDFIASAADELPLQVGNIVTIERVVDHNWLIGTYEGKTGTFPAAFVEEVIVPAPSGSGSVAGQFTPGQTVRAVETFTATTEGDLSFKKGDNIEITKVIDDNWLQGRLHEGAGVGIFPITYVAVKDAPSVASKSEAGCVEINNGTTEPAANNGSSVNAVLPPPQGIGKEGSRSEVAVEPWARALFTFSAEHPGEISFTDGDRIGLRRRIDDDWLEGEVGGNVGIFPSNYVRVEVDLAPEFATAAKPQTLHVPTANSPATAPLTKWKGKRGKVLFDFAAQTDQDLAVKQGEVVQIMDRVDVDWFEARHPSGRTGLVPFNYIKILEKPKSPSLKRPAPLPPKAASSSSVRNGTEPSANVDLLDIFSTPSVIQSPKGNPKPPLPPKSAKVMNSPPSRKAAVSVVDDLLCFDPLGVDTGTTQMNQPDAQPLKPHLDQVGFKLGASAYKPIRFTTRASPPEGVAPTDPFAGNPERTTGAVVLARPRGQSLLDMSPVDKPCSPLLAPESVPLSPPPPIQPPVQPPVQPASITFQHSHKPPPLHRKMSYEALTTAKPFSLAVSPQIHSVSRPGSSSIYPDCPTLPKTDLLTISQVTQDLDQVFDEDIRFNPFQKLSADEVSPPVPPRQPSPNPFTAIQEPSTDNIMPPLPPRQPSPNFFTANAAEEGKPPPLPPRQPSPNPFRATDLPPNLSDAPPIVVPPSQPFPANWEPPPPATALSPKPDLPLSSPRRLPSSPQPAVPLLRDDSIASDFTDDYLMQNINFSIRPSGGGEFQAAPTPAAFRLPPPPTKSELKSVALANSPRSNRRFDAGKGVPRPRGQSCSDNEDEGLYSHPQDFEVPDSNSSQADKERFQQDLQTFQACVQQMFDPAKMDGNPNDEDDLFAQLGERAGELEAGHTVITTTTTDQKASLLDGEFDVFTSDVTPEQEMTSDQSTGDSPYNADVSSQGLDIMPLFSATTAAAGSKAKPSRPPPRPKEPAPKKKATSARPTPPKFGSRTAEDEMLAKLRPEGDNQTLDAELQETLRALQDSTAELRQVIALQQDQKRSLEQTLQLATTDEETQDMEQQLTDCIGTIENLQTELQGLEDQLQDVQPSPSVPVESKLSMADFRGKVTAEILNTERDYVHDLKLCQDGFMSILKEKQDIISDILNRLQLEENERTGEKKPTKGLELEILFGNMEQVIDIAASFLTDLEETVEGKAPQDQCIGQCFMKHSEDLHKAYAEYCRNHDDATALLEKYEEYDEVQEYINQGLELVRQSTNCWDLASFLIKPVQRILKYQLLLAELEKYTEEGHPDKPSIQQARETMTDVAKAINEFKRRKDLVMKYRRTGQDAITDKLGRLNLHSIRKKSQRINQRITQMTGLTTQTVDGDFDQMERRFRNLEKTIRIFVKDVNAYLEQLKDATSSEASVGSDISDYYASQSNLHEVNKYEAAQRYLANKLYKDYTLFVQQRVISPLNGLLIMFQGPHKLIAKRYHKLLDYDSHSNKLEKSKDKDRTKQLKDDKDVSKKNYDAMNIQLKDELPKLCDMGLSLFKSCVVSFVEAERDHINSTLKKLYPLLELSIVKNNSTFEIMKTFEASHVAAVEELHKFPFVPKSLDKKGDRRSMAGAVPTPPPSAPRPEPSSQSDKQKGSVTSRYPATRVYQVCADFKAQQPMDISVKKGEIVGIIKEQDPTGSGQRWYIDNGVSQGFVPSSVLQSAEADTPSHDGYGSDDGWDTFTQMQQHAQYYYAEWAFTATGQNELSLAERDVVQLISDTDTEGNSEWWLVDKNGQRGYAPSCYLAKID